MTLVDPSQFSAASHRTRSDNMFLAKVAIDAATSHTYGGMTPASRRQGVLNQRAAVFHTEIATLHDRLCHYTAHRTFWMSGQGFGF
jgi:hypothetical protein